MLSHLYRQHTIPSRSLQATCSNRSMLSLSAVRSQSSHLFQRGKTLQVRRKSWIQSRLCECCEMRQLQRPTHGWFTRMSSEDFLSSRKETARRREERNESTAIVLLSLFSCSTVFECSSNDGFSPSCRDEDTQDDSRSSDRPNQSIFDHHQYTEGRNRAFSRSSPQSNHATRGEM